MAIFDALYTNNRGFQDKFISFFNEITKRFANNSNVIGYDPINEPFVSDFIKDNSLLFPKNFDKFKL